MTTLRRIVQAVRGADPRLYQIAVLSSLLVYGAGWVRFDITSAHAAREGEHSSWRRAESQAATSTLA